MNGLVSSSSQPSSNTGTMSNTSPASSATTTSLTDQSSGVQTTVSSTDPFSLPSAPHRLSLDLEPNPFELSFKKREETSSGSTPNAASNPQVVNGTAAPAPAPQYIATPGGRRHLLPPVASISSPQSLVQSLVTPGSAWMNSLRSGPLSPAMLPGPQGLSATHSLTSASGLIGSTTNTHIDQSTSQGLTGPLSPFTRGILTPGTTSALYSATASGTDGILNLNADQATLMGSTGLTPLGLTVNPAKDKLLPPTPLGTAPPLTSIVPLTTTAPGASNINISGPLSDAISATTVTAGNQPSQVAMFGRSDPTDAANSLYMLSRSSNESEEPIAEKPSTTKSKTKQGKGKPKRAKESSIKKETMEPLTKKRKSGNSNVFKRDLHSSDDMSPPPSDGRKRLTEEEKRKSFLERNRVAALKCRQRKKQWLENLQAKVEYYSSENDNLNTQVANLCQQVLSLKSILLQHKDCSLGLSKEAFSTIINANPTPADAAVAVSNPESLQHQAKAVAAAAAAASAAAQVTGTSGDMAAATAGGVSGALPGQPMSVLVPLVQGQVNNPLLNSNLIQQTQQSGTLPGPVMGNAGPAAQQQMIHQVATQQQQQQYQQQQQQQQPQQAPQRDFRFVV